MIRKTSNEIKELRKRAKVGDYDSIIELVKYRLDESLEDLKVTRDDHRYFQGKIHAIEAVLGDISNK